MGVVYEATQLSLDRKVALKLLTAELSADAGFRERFRHEARIQGAMDHPNIVTVHEAGESEYGLFIAMELIRGATLKDLIVGRELDAGRTLRILTQVADALDSAHEAGLIHRDIKPHNILVRAGRRDHAFLADFGVTKVRGGTNLTKTGHFVGTVDYMAPEQIRGEPATRETDIYALGTVLYECLSGAVPFPKDSDVAVMYAHLADPPPTITSERPELPPQLDAVISTAMAKNPSERYSSAMRMVEAFEGALGADGQAAVSIPGPVESRRGAGPARGRPARDGGERDELRTQRGSRRRRRLRPRCQRVAARQPAPPTEVSAAPPTTEQKTPAPETEIGAVPPPRPVPAASASAACHRRLRDRRRGASVGAATAAAARGRAGRGSGRPGRAQAVPLDLGRGRRDHRRARGRRVLRRPLRRHKSSSPSSGEISAQDATVGVPAGWHELETVPKIPHPPAPQDAAGTAADGSSGLVMGAASLTYPWLLPSGADRPRVGPAEDVVQLPAAPRRNRPAPGLADLRRQLLEVGQAALHLHLLPAGEERDHDGGLLLEDRARSATS